MRYFILILILFCFTSLHSAELADLPEDMRKLVIQLKDGDDKERKAAAKALGKMKEKAQAALPWMEKQMASEESVWVKKELRNALKRIGKAEGDDKEKEEKVDISKLKSKGADGEKIPLPNPKKMKGRVIFSPDGIGKMGGGPSNCTVAVKEIPGVKNNNKYVSMHLKGEGWSGNIINWCEFWDGSPFAVQTKQHTHMVVRCLHMGRPGDINLTFAVQFKGIGGAEGVQSDFLRLSNYDAKHQLQKSKTFVDVEIPIADLKRSIPKDKQEFPIWGIHFGAVTKAGVKKDMGLLLKGIYFIKK